MKYLYLAGPLFCEAELSFNLELKKLLTPYFEVYLPQEDGGLLTTMIEEGSSVQFASRTVFNKDIEAMKKADCFLIILDGRTIDEGAAFELGFSYASKKTCVAYQSDSRRLLKHGNNPMIENAVAEIFRNKQELLEWAIAISDLNVKDINNATKNDFAGIVRVK